MKTIKILDSALGPVLKVKETYFHKDGSLILLVDPNGAENIPSDNINNTVSNAFIYIVNKFLEKNNIDFKPNGNFYSNSGNKFHTNRKWKFKIEGSTINPIEYFIEKLNESK